jgi:GTPase Era involved in 16S rRNA processing
VDKVDVRLVKLKFCHHSESSILRRLVKTYRSISVLDTDIICRKKRQKGILIGKNGEKEYLI